MNPEKIGVGISEKKLRKMMKGVMTSRAFSTIVAGGISFLASEEKAKLIIELRREGVMITEDVSDGELKKVCSLLMDRAMRMAKY